MSEEEIIEHSPFGGSQVGRFLKCPGSVQFCEGLPETGTKEYKEEGTTAHQLAAVALQSSASVLNKTIKDMRHGGYISKNAMKYVDTEMLEHVKGYVNTCKELSERLMANLHAERYITLEEFLRSIGVEAKAFGTADCVIHKQGKSLVVIDFKYGKGVAVDVQDNPQLLFYALGVYHKYYGNDDANIAITIGVYQPRSWRKDGENILQTQKITSKELLTWGADVLAPAIMRAQDADAPLVFGDHCNKYFCKGMPMCPAIIRSATNMMEKNYAPAEVSISEVSLPDIERLNPEDYAKILALTAVLKPWIKKFEDATVEKLLNGGELPELKLVRKRRRRVWRDEEETEETLAMFLSDKELYKTKVLQSISKVEKTLDKKLIKPLWKWQDGGLTVAVSGDPRPAVQLEAERVEAAMDAFANNKYREKEKVQ